MLDNQEIIPFSEIMKIEKKSGFTFSFYIKTQAKVKWFGVFIGWNKGEEAFLMLFELWQQQLQRTQQHLDGELHTSKKSKMLDPTLYANQDKKVIEKRRADLDAQGSDQRRVTVKRTDSHELLRVFGAASVAKKILNERKSQKFQRLFRLPQTEQLLDGYPITASYWRREFFCEGHLYLSCNFICYYSNEDESLVIFVIPFSEVKDIVKQNNMFGLGSNKITIETQSHTNPNEFLFQLQNRNKHFEEIWQLWKFCIQKLGQSKIKENQENNKIENSTPPREEISLCGKSITLSLSESSSRISFHGGKKQTSENIWGDMLEDRQIFSQSYLPKQKKQERFWQKYLALNGSGITMLRTNDFPEICKRGIPDYLRGKIWMYGSGAMMKAAAQPGYYRHLLESNANESTQALVDIGWYFITSIFVQSAGIQ